MAAPGNGGYARRDFDRQKAFRPVKTASALMQDKEAPGTDFVRSRGFLP